jgi:hypothetical protein
MFDVVERLAPRELIVCQVVSRVNHYARPRSRDLGDASAGA